MRIGWSKYDSRRIVLFDKHERLYGMKNMPKETYDLPSITVLGVCNNDVAGACLVKDGKIAAAASEERFTRVKDDSVWPTQAIEFVLKEAGLELEDVDYLAYGWNAGFDQDRHLMLYVDRIIDESRFNPRGLPYIRQRIFNELKNDKSKRREFDDYSHTNGLEGRTVYLDHHECHAVGAFACSPFDEALVVTCDGRGDFQALTVSHYGENDFRLLQQETTIDSLGYFYGRITKLLGYKANRHEGKVTGLAAFGNPEPLLPVMREMIAFKEGELRARCGPLYRPSYDGFEDEVTHLFDRESPENVAAAAQCHTEEILAAVVEHHITAIGPSNVCLAGGVFGNVKLNQRIREVAGVRNVYVLPCMGDGGLALAAAVGVAYQKSGTRFLKPSMKLGPNPEAFLPSSAILAKRYPDLSVSEFEDPIPELTRALAADQVIGMVKGRMEFGPRALCNRSIVYHAQDRSVNDWLNKRMHRTEFMPFAPVTASEHAPNCYTDWQLDHVAAEFMTMTYNCEPGFWSASPAIVHVDGTARPQVISKASDPFMHRLLHAWFEESGQMALINTSFNRHEEPIILSTDSAVEALHERIIDLVVLEERFVLRRPQ